MRTGGSEQKTQDKPECTYVIQSSDDHDVDRILHSGELQEYRLDAPGTGKGASILTRTISPTGTMSGIRRWRRHIIRAIIDPLLPNHWWRGLLSSITGSRVRQKPTRGGRLLDPVDGVDLSSVGVSTCYMFGSLHGTRRWLDFISMKGDLCGGDEG
jgi:hypothetical protein